MRDCGLAHTINESNWQQSLNFFFASSFLNIQKPTSKGKVKRDAKPNSRHKGCQPSIVKGIVETLKF
jgi:hypothetical protein